MGLASRPAASVTSRSPSPTTLVATAVLTSAGAIAAQVMGRATRDALFLSSFAVKRLPGVMLVGAAASLGAAVLMGKLIARHSPARVMPAAFTLSGALFGLDWAVAGFAPRLVALIVYVHMAVFGPILISTFWSSINERFDPRTAKRYVGWISSGATTGGIVGGTMALAAARSASLRGSLLVLAALHLGCALLAQLFGRGRPSRATPALPREAPSALQVLRDVPYLRQLALLVSAIA